MNKMALNVFLISLEKDKSFENYNTSIKNPIKLNQISNKQKNNSKVSIWELNHTKDNYKIWNQIKKHDIILFLRQGNIFSKARIISKTKRIEVISNRSNQQKNPKIKKLNLFFYEIQKIRIGFNTTNSILMDPLMPEVYNFPISIIKGNKMKELIKIFKNVEDVIDFFGNPDNKDKSISEIINSKRIENTTVTSEKILKNQRKGQEKFRKNILENFHNKCAVCSNEEKELLQAAHIIPVEDENKAGLLKNGICLCVLCHMLFDKGFFSFDEKFRVIFSNKKKIDKVLKKIIVEKKKIGKSTYPPSTHYLAAHRAKFEIFNC